MRLLGRRRSFGIGIDWAATLCFLHYGTAIFARACAFDGTCASFPYIDALWNRASIREDGADVP